MAPKENSLKKIYRSEFIQSGFIFVMYLLNEVYRNDEDMRILERLALKCGNIMSGFGKCFDCRESHLLCDLPKVLTDKSRVCTVELVLLEYFVSSIKTLRECLV